MEVYKMHSRYVEPVNGKRMISYKDFIALQGGGTINGVSLENKDVVVCPTYMTPKAVGADCWASETIIIEPWQVGAVKIGIKAKFPGNEEGLFAFSRSSIPEKKGLILANGVGVIEEDYYGNPDNDGELGFKFLNYTPYPVTIERFERVGQIVLANISRFVNCDNAKLKRGRSGSTGE